MKSIQLTEEHKVKLLEMCKKLFPEYEEIHIHGSNIYFDITEYMNWFEFCMTYLIEKISEKSKIWEDIPPYVSNVYGNAEGKWNVYTKFHFHYPKNRYQMHIIDYLYEEFKKLKV